MSYVCLYLCRTILNYNECRLLLQRDWLEATFEFSKKIEKKICLNFERTRKNPVEQK